MSRWQVPPAWAWAKVEDIAEVVGGGTPSVSDPSNFAEDGTPWVTPADLSGYQGAYISKGARSLSAQGLATSNARVLPAGSVLFSSRAPIGYAAIAANPIATNQGFKSLVPGEGMDPHYVRYYLLASREYAESLASGSTFKELSGARMKELLVPVPPAAEQRRIVAKLDELLAGSRAVRAALDPVPALLERYQKAMLTAAFTPAPGDAPWPTSRLGDLVADGRKISYGVLKPGTHDPSGVRLLKSGQIRDGYLDLSDDFRITPELDAQYWRTRLQGGEVLLNLVGASIGRSAIAPLDLRGANVSRAIAVIPIREGLAEWVQLALQGPAGRELMRNATGGSAQPVLNLSEVREITIPLPDERARERRCSATREALKRIDALSAMLTDVLARSTLMERSILARALRGELASQDPNDEPASTLLERLLVTRESSRKPKRPKSSTTTKKPPRAHKDTAVTKSRFDPDVKEQPYLANLLREAKGVLSVEDLYLRSDLSLVDFYKQLAWEVAHDKIQDDSTHLQAL